MNTRNSLYALFVMAVLIFAACTDNTADDTLYEQGVDKTKVINGDKKSVDKTKVINGDKLSVDRTKVINGDKRG